MKNRTLVFLTGLVLASMLLLLALNLNSILTGSPKNQTYFKYNDVQGIAVKHHGLLYTLNFTQQNTFIDLFNRAVRVVQNREYTNKNPTIEEIVVYALDGQPEVHIFPIGYEEDNMVFSIPQWDSDSYFMELSRGVLEQMLSKTYDP